MLDVLKLTLLLQIIVLRWYVRLMEATNCVEGRMLGKEIHGGLRRPRWVLLDTSENAHANSARVALYYELYDQSGAAEAWWAYPTGPKMERSIRRLITSVCPSVCLSVDCEWLCLLVCCLCFVLMHFLAVLRAGVILRGG